MSPNSTDNELAIPIAFCRMDHAALRMTCRAYSTWDRVRPLKTRNDYVKWEFAFLYHGELEIGMCKLHQCVLEIKCDVVTRTNAMQGYETDFMICNC
jgi:hypothetical protein